MGRLKFSGKNKLKFFFPRNFFDNSFLHRRDIIYWLNGKKRRKRKFYPEHYIHKDLTNKDENKEIEKKNMTILNIFGLVNSKKESKSKEVPNFKKIPNLKKESKLKKTSKLKKEPKLE